MRENEFLGSCSKSSSVAKDNSVERLLQEGSAEHSMYCDRFGKVLWHATGVWRKTPGSRIFFRTLWDFHERQWKFLSLVCIGKVDVDIFSRWKFINGKLFSWIHSDEGLTLETSVFESFTVANLPYRPCG